MPGTFGKKPSNSHVVWTNREGEGRGKKRFDFEYLKLWAANFGVDYETRTRVDHDRADEPRDQHLVVFEWATAKNQTIEMGDKTWEVGGNETPRTFVEIDEAGDARIKSWDHEVVVDIREMYLEGPVLRMRTANRGKKALDTRKLLQSESDSDG
jgi:hypothetical protein